MNLLEILSANEVEAIHQATLRILAETGVHLTHPASREILTGAGATLAGPAVQFPPELVEACIARCPAQVRIRGRGGALQILGDGALHFHNLGGARDVYDPRYKQFRYASLADLQQATRLLDALEHCTTVTPFFTPCDVPGSVMSLAMYRHALSWTAKPVQGPGLQNAAEARFAARMAAVIGPPQEMLTLSVSPISPLTISDHQAEAILEVARQGIAFGPLPCPTAGATAPVTLAGALAQQNAEVLAALALAQLAQPGLPMIYCGRLAMMEPRSGVSVWGGVELALASAATVQIGHRYHLPVNVYGFSTNAHTLEMQSGFERGLNAAIPALAGADELSGIGEMEAGVSGSLAQMVADNEHAAVIQRLRRGFAATADTLAVEVIAAVMAGNRNFLAQKHTLRHLKAGEILFTRLAERGARESWETGGRNDFSARAQAEAERLLNSNQPTPLDPAQEKELDALLAAASVELA